MPNENAKIIIAASHSKLTKVRDTLAVEDTINALTCQFVFRTSDWNDTVKTAAFVKGWATPTTSSEDIICVMLDENNECVVPPEVLENKCLFSVGVFGVADNYRIPSNWMYYKIADGCYAEGSSSLTPTPSVYEQILIALNSKSDIGHTHNYEDILDKPITLSGYGITDAYTQNEVDEALSYKADKINGTIVSDNADYAEILQWYDNNLNLENRLYRFVELDADTPGNTIKIASENSDVVGVTVEAPAFAGNALNKFDNSGNLLPRYAFVAVHGIVPVIDNGTCTPKGRCISAADGTAMPSTNGIGYFCMERIDTNHIMIVVEPNADMLTRIKADIVQLQESVANADDLIEHITDHNNPHLVTKAQVGLGNVDNTSDANKPISNAVRQVLDNKADNEDIPTKVSELENDVGYLTLFTETDPTVPNWAKQSTKPTYTYDEIQGTPPEVDLSDYATKEYVDNKGAKYTIQKIQDYLYYINYDELNYETGIEFCLNRFNPVPGACSAIRKGNFYGRNYDWYYDENATFIINRKATSGKFASIGVASGLITDEVANSGEYNELYDYLPFITLDGINENGVVCNINVLPELDAKGHTTGTNPGQQDVPMACLVRCILDDAASADDAIYKIQHNYNIIAPNSERVSSEMHFMIADENKTYVVEFVNNSPVIIEQFVDNKPIMTNFYLTGYDGTRTSLTPYAMGIERQEVLSDGFDDVATMDDMSDLMKSVFYTKAYSVLEDPIWYSEFSGQYQTFGNLTKDSTPEEYAPLMTYVRNLFTSRQRDGSTWQTVHSSVYDIEHKKLNIIVQENNNKYQFVLNVLGKDVRDIDYNTLLNKPQINGVTLIGNKTLEDLNIGITSLSNSDIENILRLDIDMPIPESFEDRYIIFDGESIINNKN